MTVIEHERVETLLPELTKPDATAELLERAADLIEMHGWVQGKMRSTDGRFCALGAIAFVRNACLSWNEECSAAAKRFAERGIGVSYSHPSSVFMWNDAIGNTKEQVVAAFRRASAA